MVWWCWYLKPYANVPGEWRGSSKLDDSEVAHRLKSNIRQLEETVDFSYFPIHDFPCSLIVHNSTS